MNVRNTTDLFLLFNCDIKGPVPQKAIQALIELKLIPQPGKYKCPNGHILQLLECEEIDGWEWRCTEKIKNKKGNKYCRSKKSLRKNTFFDKSKLSIFQILEFILQWCNNLPLNIILKEASITSPTTGTDWNNFCREVIVCSPFQNDTRIGGPGVIVEIDETKIGKRKYHRGHYVEGQWVFGGVERESGRCFMVPVENRSNQTLTGIIKKYIRPNSIIVSDGWKAYEKLEEEGYEHYIVNHSEHFKNPETNQHTNTIEGLWRHLKASLPTYNRRKIFFNGYIQKFIFLRWCKANNKNELFEFCRYAGSLYDPLQATDVERQRYVEEPTNIWFSEDNIELNDDSLLEPLG